LVIGCKSLYAGFQSSRIYCGKYITETELEFNSAGILSFVSFHGPIDEAYQAAKFLSETKGGEVYWVIPDRVFRFDDVEVSPGITVKVWFMGSALRRKNCVLFRRGWWALYLWDPYIKALARALGTWKR